MIDDGLRERRSKFVSTEVVFRDRRRRREILEREKM